ELSRSVEVLARLCAEHDLPGEPEALQLRAAALAAVTLQLQALAGEAVRLLSAARRLEEDGESAERDDSEAQRADEEATAAGREAAGAAQESATLLETLGADVQRLQAELSSAQQDQRRAARDRDTAGRQVLDLTGRRGEARALLQAAEQRLAEAVPLVAQECARVTALAQVPGLLAGALGSEPSVEERSGLAALDAVPMPRPVLQLLTAWAAEGTGGSADANTVYRDIASLAAGPAADHEPRVVVVGEHLTVLARDGAGAEQPLALVVVRLNADVARERELLTDRERTLFEEHLLGELGDAVRSRRDEAADLVQGMNGLLADVKTSQGIRVRLDWALREDTGADVRAAVELLGRPHGSLAAEEAGRLRDALSALIEVERAADPERGYTEHLARALDYRRWSAFSVRLHRPGGASWTTLTRRTPLSQGEQKVVCYLPLFAAAAAHFTSVAGAAPYAPRLILLDDAFPKIDVGTHPLLFGLLVDLDLDFVLTSERLWGDHATVPSLAVYEALRSPGERGIAQYRYSWDGTTLVGHG
ncbi:MAG: exonuclease SbcC, partial [Pseudorhodobacter sp.]|nr:exonuclease SbcC [Frankiaceae bacterium]